MFEGNEKIRIRYYRSLNGEDKYHALNDILHSSKSVVFLGGAGVSTESGIPDFRSKDGLSLFVKVDVSSSRYIF